MYGRGYEHGTRKQRTPRKKTVATLQEQVEMFTRWWADKTPEELLAMDPIKAKEELKTRHAA
jgi:hypothetical protein